MKKSKPVLKSYFETGDKPTESQFSDLIDSLVHLDEGVFITNVEKDDKGNQIITLSDGTSIVIEKPTNKVLQNNKIRIIDLGIIQGGNEFELSVEETLARTINTLDPPLIVQEDENIIFEFNINDNIGGEEGIPT